MFYVIFPLSVMDKWVVNNYIVQMRGGVKQARVHTVKKLVREIRRLQNKKGSDQEKEKNRRKAEKFRQEVLIMKELDLNQISRYALLCPENPSDMLSKVSLPPEERAKVRLAAHKSIAVQVEIFRAKFTDWALKLPPLLVQLGLKNKYRKKIGANRNRYPAFKSDITDDYEKDKDLHESSDEAAENKSDVSDNDDEQLHESSVTNTEKKLVINCKKSEKLHESSDENTENKSSVDYESHKQNEDYSTNSQKDNETSSGPQEISTECQKKKIRGIAEVRRFADMLDSGNNSENSDNESDNSDKSALENEVTDSVADPFFLRSGESDRSDDDSEEDKRKSYNSRIDGVFAGKNDNQFGRSNVSGRRDWNFKSKYNSQFSRGDQGIPTLNRKQRRLLERTQAQMKGKTTSLQTSLLPNKFESSRKKAFERHPKPVGVQLGNSAETQGVLHPSWEAKRKQREQQIVQFQGKKIKFDDDD